MKIYKLFIIYYLSLNLFNLIDLINSSDDINYDRNFVRQKMNSRNLRISQNERRSCSIPIKFKNGQIKKRQRGKLIQFQCYKTYKLIGNSYSTCLRSNKWDSPTPFCAKKGCIKLNSPENGFIIEENGGLSSTFFCEEFYKPAGIRTIYCDGINWTQNFGECRASKNGTELFCDFEVDDLCGWTNDDNGNFEWKRHTNYDSNNNSNNNNNNLLRLQSTGPKYDHTKLSQNIGHYMLIESTQSMENERARLISPIYNNNNNNNNSYYCYFKFYYFMYGATVGTLRIYIKPLSIDMDLILEETSQYKYFEKCGNQNNSWQEGLIKFNTKFNESFQIIIEGTGGSSHLSDIAIDDVELITCNENNNIINNKTSNNNNNNNNNNTDINNESSGNGNDGISSEDDDVGDIIFDVQSCEMRCNETESYVNNTKMLIKKLENGSLIKLCDCHDECDDLKTCCPDYYKICIFNENEEDTATTTTAITAITMATSNENEENYNNQTTLIPLKISTINDNNKVNLIDYEFNENTKTTTIKTILKFNITNENEVKMTTPKVVIMKTTRKQNEIHKNGKNENDLFNGSSFQPNLQMTTLKYDINYTKKNEILLRKNEDENEDDNEIDMNFSNKSGTEKIWKITTKTETKINDETNSNKTILIIFIIIIILIVIILIFNYVVKFYRKTYSIENYKKNAKDTEYFLENNETSTKINLKNFNNANKLKSDDKIIIKNTNTNKTNENFDTNKKKKRFTMKNTNLLNQEEFSEIRYLTSDEQIDFTMLSIND